jgi:multimeric flavodoxin WrbA
LIEILSISGSPTEGSSTDRLLDEIAIGIRAGLSPKIPGRVRRVRLADLDFIPCQACGEAPTPKFCFFDDDLTEVYSWLARCDCLLFGSPIFFDTVSAQAKAFIDRCNCVRPADFDNVNPDHQFIKLLTRKRPGAMALVGGEKGYFEGARRVIAGFFKWVEVVNEGMVIHHSTDFTRSATVAGDPVALNEARELGRRLARMIGEK